MFDEADPIATRRSTSVDTGAQRESNSVANVLLQELHRYTGVVIFATNLAANFDPAFERGIQTHVLFELPGATEHLQIYYRDKNTFCSLSPDGSRLIVDVQTAAAKPHRKEKLRAVYDHMYAESMYGRMFADSLVLYDTRSGRRVCELEDTEGPGPFDLSASELIFSPDNRMIAAGGRREAVGTTAEKRKLRFWNAETCKQTAAIDADTEAPLGFSEDGKLLYTRMGVAQPGSASVGVHVWDVASGKVLFDLPEVYASSGLIKLTPNGKALISPDQGNTLGIWDRSTGKRLGSMRPLQEQEWLVTTPSGLFDGSPRGWKQIAWRDSDGLGTQSRRFSPTSSTSQGF